jgi:hypothetical protein
MARVGRELEGFAFGLINELLGLVHDENGVARPNRFEVVIFPPTSSAQTRNASSYDNLSATLLGDLVKDGTLRSVAIKCTSISFPAKTLQVSQDTNIYGPVREIVNGIEFGDLQANFTMLRSDMKEKKYFEAWQGLTFNPASWSVGYYDDYVGSVEIYQLDEQNRRKYGIKLIEAFPKIVGEMALDMQTGNTVSTLPITFSYRYWEPLEGQSQIPNRILGDIADLVGNTVERKILSKIPKVLSRL